MPSIGGIDIDASTGNTRYLAFLRAINVGGRTIKMADLRDIIAQLDVAKVETFIASGNVVFDAATTDVRALEQLIENHLRETLGYEVDTFIRAPAELATIAQYQPFPAMPEPGKGSAMQVAFLHTAPGDDESSALLACRTATDDIHIHDRELYWLRSGRMDESAFTGVMLEKILKAPATMRNWNTIQRMATRYCSVSL